ncbi:sensor histidine kinase [Pseudochryseolinea flava]|uniref:Signal transduction histidine kinase internal region domain-containing protein n=1 Tax=Pseudochryseolinea flava TaxID=2059302 RepID=A0A364XVZ7_9BACT|nr:sensor histidine kinase [Pseudochryseolinea flava]RAV98514.1 hypothetical protein DQQ10_23625 [Pseudochryseolinea flava]
MQRPIQRLLIVLLSLGGTCSVFAQTLYYNNYTTSAGLPSNTVYYATQDHDGFLWFGTDAGVCKYDGHSFTTYTPQHHLSDNEIFRIIEDSQQRLWFLPFNGRISYYKNGSFFNSSNDSTLAALDLNDIYSGFQEDHLGNIWVSAMTKGIFLLHADGSSTAFPRKLANNNAALDHTVFYLWSHQKKIYALTSTGILIFDPADPKRYLFREIPGMSLTSDASRKIYIDTAQTTLHFPLFNNTAEGSSLADINYGEFTFTRKPSELTILGMLPITGDSSWVYHTAGVTHWNSKTPTIKEATSYLPGAIVSHALKDTDNGFWFTTLNRGVYYVPSPHIKRIPFENSLENPVRRIHLTPKRDILAVRENGAFASIDAKDYSIRHFPSPIPTDNVRVDEIISDGDTTWITGKAVGIIKLVGNQVETSFPRATINSIAVLPDRFILETGYAGLKVFNRSDLNKRKDVAFFYAPEGRIFFERTNALCLTAEQQILCGTRKGLVKIENGETSNFSSIHPYLKHRIKQIEQARDGNIWILVDATAIVVLDRDFNLVSVLDDSNGIGQHAAIRFYIDENDVTWIVSRHKVYRASVAENKIQLGAIFTSETVDFNDITSDNTNLWLATAEGIIILPKTFQQQNEISAHVTSMFVNGEKQAMTTRELILPYDQNNIRLVLAARSFTTNDIYYRYKIRDTDSTWTMTKSNELEFSSLQPGDYHFSVQARNADGQWSKYTKSLSIQIKKPIWYEWWFIMGAMIIVIFTTSLIIRNAYHANYKKVLLHDRLIESELKALVAQMNPHFIFNTLNTIQKFFITSDTKTANRLLSRFSKLMRMILDNTSRSFVTIEAEIAFLNHYLEIESMRFNQQFDFEILTAPNLDTANTFIPSMTIQPFVENALIHGIMPLKKKGRIVIRFSMLENGTYVEVEDNGVGRTINHNRTHVPRGINLIRERLSILSNKSDKVYRMEIVDQKPPEQGTRVLLYL